jgi:hypothetical protein
MRDDVLPETAQPVETVEAVRARQTAEVEALLVKSGVELYALVLEQVRWQIGQGTVTPALASLLAQARASMLRGLRQPEKITRQEAPAGGGAAPSTKEGRSFDFAAFAQLFLSLAGRGGAGPGPAGADDPALALGASRADDEAGGLPGGAGP